ncbi:MAG: FCD domain-containing protein [Solirubrobacterales bacterium]|nr:FCD domain-containing protein [Solirubrobacterales bacterium]
MRQLKPDTRTSATFHPIDQPRAHEYVAEQIRRQIALGLLAPGSPLPTERELAALFGVGRATVQQAIRVLEAELLVETRRGRHGGSSVTAKPTDRLAMDYLLARLRGEASRIAAAVELREILEPRIAARAVETGDRRFLGDALAAARRGAGAESDPKFMGADTEFHLAIARATGNQMLVEAIEQIRLTLNDVLFALPDSPLWHQRSVIEHERIAAAWQAGDPTAAEAAMAEHIAETASSIHALMASLEDASTRP